VLDSGIVVLGVSESIFSYVRFNTCETKARIISFNEFRSSAPFHHPPVGRGWEETIYDIIIEGVAIGKYALRTKRFIGKINVGRYTTSMISIVNNVRGTFQGFDRP